MNIPSATDFELKEPMWWMRHHKGNVLYLALRIKKLIEEPDNEDYEKFFHNHFKAVLPEFLKSAGWEDPDEPIQSKPISDENTS